MLQPRIINQTIVICNCCRRPISLQVDYGNTVRVPCICGNIIVETFQPIVLDRKAELRRLIDREPANRWEAINIEFLIDELKDLEKNC